MYKASYTVTSVGQAPNVERGQRMRKYVITMSIRMACIAAIPFVQGWWILVCTLGAVFLPYIAVVLANVKESSTEDSLPDGVVLELESVDAEAQSWPSDAAKTMIVGDETSIRVTRVERDE